MKRISLIVLGVCMAALLAVAAYAYDDIQLPGTNTAPVIDGKLDDCYVKIHDFYSPNENEWYDNADLGHDAQGEAWGTWDAENFYAFFKIAEEDYFPQNGEADPPGSNYSSMYLALLATEPVNDLPEDDLYVMQCSFNRSIEDTKEWKYTGSVVEKYRDNSASYAVYDTCPFDFEVVNDGKYTYYEVKMPWDQIDRTGKVSFTEGHKWFFNYIITWQNDTAYNTVQYGQGLMNDIYDMGGVVTLTAAPAGSGSSSAAAPAGERATVAKGADGSLQIPKTPVAMTMDGYLDDTYAKLTDFYATDGFRTDYDAEKSIKGAAYTAWDDDKFYMFLEVLTPEFEPIFDVQAIDMGIGPAGYVALLGTADGSWTDDQRFEIGIALADEDIPVWKVSSPADIKDSSADNFWFDECPYSFGVRRDAETNYLYYEFGIPWSFLDRTDMLTYTEGSQFILNYAANVHTTTDYSNGASHIVEFGGGIWAGSYTDGAVVTLVGGSGEAAAPAQSGPAQPYDTIEIPQKAVTVDGVIGDGEWDGATRMTLNISDTSTWTENGAGIVGTDGWSKLGHTDDDFSTDLAFTVDGDNLYILLTRKDSTLNFASDNYHRPYSSDCALMWFYDPDYAAQYGLQLLAANKKGEPIIGYFFMDSDQNDSINLMEEGYAEAVTKTTADSYIMEAKINMNGMDDFSRDMLANGKIRVTWCAVNICEEGWDSDDDQHVLWGTYNYQAQYKGVNDWENAPIAKLVGEGSASGTAPAATELLNKSWDNIFIDGEMMVNGSANVWLADNPIEDDIFQLTVRGWSYLSTPITGFAYTIDGGDAVKSADYIVDRPDVKAAISEEAEGFEIAVDVDGLAEGDHLLKFYALDANGEMVDTTFDLPFTIIRAAEPDEEPAPDEPAEPAEEPTPAEEPAEEPAAEEPAAEEPEPEPPTTEPTPPAPAPEAKSGCGSFLGGGLIVLVTLLGSAWIAKRK